MKSASKSGWPKLGQNGRAYTLSTLLVVTSGSVLLGQVYYLAGIVGLLGAAIALCPPRRLVVSSIYVLLIALGLLGLNAIFYQGNDSGYLGLAAKLLAVFLIWNGLPRQHLVRSLVDVVAFLATVSIPSYIFGALSPGTVRSNVGITHAWNGEFRVTPFHVFGFYDMSRNQGIFWEAGAYAIILAGALAICLFGMERPGWYRPLILVGTILTTFSTTGYLLLCLILVGFLSRSFQRIPLGAVVAAAASLTVLAYFAFNAGVVSEKFTTGNASFARRTLDAKVAAGLIGERPFGGWGYQNNDIVKRLYYLPDISNSVLGIAYQFGLPVLAICLVVYWIALMRLTPNLWLAVLMYIALLIAFWSENMPLQPVFLLLFFVAGGKHDEDHAGFKQAPNAKADDHRQRIRRLSLDKSRAVF